MSYYDDIKERSKKKLSGGEADDWKHANRLATAEYWEEKDSMKKPKGMGFGITAKEKSHLYFDTMQTKKKGQDKIEQVMSEFKAGKLRSSSGQKVTSKDQAIAIAMNEAGMAKKSIPDFRAEVAPMLLKAQQYQVGEVSQKTGKKKVAPGKWVGQGEGQVGGGEQDPQKEAKLNDVKKKIITLYQQRKEGGAGRQAVDTATDVIAGKGAEAVAGKVEQVGKNIQGKAGVKKEEETREENKKPTKEAPKKVVVAKKEPDKGKGKGNVTKSLGFIIKKMAEPAGTKKTFADGYTYQKMPNGKWVKIGKAGHKKTQEFGEKKPDIKPGQKVRIKPTASSLGRGLIGKIQSFVGKTAKVIDSMGRSFSVPVDQLAFAKSDHYDWVYESDLFFFKNTDV